MNFEQALKALKEGQKVQRKIWNEKNMFVYLTEESQLWKDELREGQMKKYVAPHDRSDTLMIMPHIDMVDEIGMVIIGWLPTCADLFADDWMIIKGDVI